MAAKSRAAGPDWAALARSLKGTLVRPGDRQYGTARLLYNTRFDGVRPAAVAYCETPQDVRECLDFARRSDVRIAPRAGGHSYLGASTTTGLVVDVTRMASVGVQSGTAVVGAGARLVDVYDKLAAKGVTVPGGSCPTVGITGLALGGGIGVTSRAYGLTSDNLLGAQVVTADGKILDCDANHHPDLYWALRGGGGGHFGVVTSLRLRTHPAPAVTVFFLHWPWRRAAAVVRGWQGWAPHAPDALWSNCHLQTGAGTPTVSVGGLYLGPAADVERQLAKLTAAIGAEPSSRLVQPTSYLHAMMIMAGCSKRTEAQCHLPWQAPGGQLSRDTYNAKSDIVSKPLPAAGIAGFVHAVEARTARREAGAILLDALGGVVNRVRSTDTAFAHRDGLYTVQYLASWGQAAAPAVAARALAWLRTTRAGMRAYVSGQAYQNYPDPDLTDWRQAYYGPNYARLVKVKAAYDPDQLFRPPQAIPPR